MNTLLKLINNNGKNHKIIKEQKKSPLMVYGYSPLKIYSVDEKVKKVLIDIYFQNHKKETFIAYDLQLETSFLLPYKSYLFKNNLIICPNTYAEIFNINPIKENYVLYNDIPDKIKKKISELIFLGNNKVANNLIALKSDNVTLIFPFLAIGSFFYFPTSHVRRMFLKQEITNFLEDGLSNCENAQLCFKNTNEKISDITVKLAFLYFCFPKSRQFFYNAFSFFIKNKIRELKEKNKTLEEKEKPSKYILSFPNFKFPVFDEFQIELRGEYLDDNNFLVYEIIESDFKKILNHEKISYHFEGKEKSETCLTKFYKKMPTKGKSISHKEPYNRNSFEETIEMIKKDSYLDSILVLKGDAISRGEKYYAKAERNLTEKTEGLTLSDEEDINSLYSKSKLNYTHTNRFDFEKAIELLKKILKLDESKCIFDKSKYTYYLFEFFYINRNYLIIEFKDSSSATFMVSSLYEINIPYVYNKIYKMKSIPNYKLKTLKRILKDDNYFLHARQFHKKNDDTEKWVNRLIEKIKEMK